MALLKLEDICVNYGSISALKGISLEVKEGEVITLIGSNGAGKSTTMRAVMGLAKISSGKITYNGEDITNKDTQNIVKKSVILSPEGRQVFPKFTVEENLYMGAYTSPKDEIEHSLNTVYKMFPKLLSRKIQVAGTLSGGEQQMLAIGRAMMSNPKLLLLDEPSLGLAPLIIKEIFEMIDRIRQMGTTILLVEQNAKIALKHSDRAYVLETGKIVLEDTAENLLNSDEVQKAYLGGI